MSRSPGPEARRSQERRHIFLTGFMAAGKTAVGDCLAGLLGRPFTDLDREVERHTGMEIPQIFERRGEEFFRQAESETLAKLLSRPASVVATGGGTMLAPGNRRLLRKCGVSVWLDVPLEILLGRLASQKTGSRPLYRDPERARSLYRERLEIYRLSDYRIPIGSDEGVEQIAQRISRLVGESACDI